MAQHTFLVAYDSDVRIWEWDYDHERELMDGKTIYLNKNWVEPTHNNFIEALDNELADHIGSAINYLNRKMN